MVYIYFDVWFPILMVLFVLIVVLISMRIRRRRLEMAAACVTIDNAPVVVTSATHTAPGGYPVTQMPPPGGYQTNVTVAPYPTHQQPHMQMQMPMPMPMPGMQPSGGMQPHMAPYPPMGAQSSAMNPPSYDVAVAGVGAGYPNQSAYEKQAPYNPSFTAQ
ncbi:protein shisa-5 isoform X2 [Teleopsis dalmanni]|uniref:protein shisa-5 isoform X2 n=1 Tax=Teleopsis dalmanni TaxID=139649 RepID=UPI0018CF804D|nr:protein shisa-5 isoform X2 [Teleopsis dalmanni]